MNNQVDLSLSVYELTHEHPELIPILSSLGFSPLENESLRKTLGKVTNLKQGCRLLKIPLNDLIQVLEWNGYQVKQ